MWVSGADAKVIALISLRHNWPKKYLFNAEIYELQHLSTLDVLLIWKYRFRTQEDLLDFFPSFFLFSWTIFFILPPQISVTTLFTFLSGRRKFWLIRLQILLNGILLSFFHFVSCTSVSESIFNIFCKTSSHLFNIFLTPQKNKDFCVQKLSEANLTSYGFDEAIT